MKIRFNRRALPLAAAVMLALSVPAYAAAAAAPQQVAAAEAPAVTIDNFAFAPVVVGRLNGNPLVERIAR